MLGESTSKHYDKENTVVLTGRGEVTAAWNKVFMVK